MGKLETLESFLGLDQKEDWLRNFYGEGLDHKQVEFFFLGREGVLSSKDTILFFKKSKRIKYDWLYWYFHQSDWLSNKQFGFRAKNSKDHAVIEFVINIYNSSY